MNVVPIIKTGVRSRPENFGALIFTNRTPILALNSDAVKIWNLCDGKHSIAEILSTINGGGNGDQATSEMVQEFLDSFVKLDLIELIPNKQEVMKLSQQ